MDNEGSVQRLQPKQERSRTRWTPALDKTFADLVLKQIQLGNRPNNVFDKKTWNTIRDEFNRQTDLNFNNNQLRKHLDVLRTRFYSLKSAHNQTNDYALEDPCCIEFDHLWADLGVQQPRPETTKVKDCPIYDQLCTIFTDSAADGKYAQSSHYEGLDKSAGTKNAGLSSFPDAEAPHSANPPSSRPEQGNTLLAEKVTKVAVERKRKRTSDAQSSEVQSRRDQEKCDAMAKALQDMIAASKLRAAATMPIDDKFSISNCIRALDEIQDIEEQLYFAAVDLFDNPSLRETFISLKGDHIRLTWLQGKCSKTTHS
ncbi:L10-interacting MYB domain-containing protein-like [Argentina anserina]|uniref:L10-interacting MYB domain-containing protein-like n=1 Tax=Argentina anserina TaxID=57926 RepID=UPI0021763525|nr:L10-interacting MYB domain-containing protein-like [Potentilla anserina]